MIKYIAALLLDVGQAAKAGNATAVHYACKNVVQEIARIDPKDFAPQVRADFVAFSPHTIHIFVQTARRWAA